MSIKWMKPYPPMPSRAGTKDMAKGARDEEKRMRVRARLAEWLGRWGADLLLTLGGVLVSAGVGWIYPPAGLITAGALLIGVPVGILTAVFMARFCPKRLYRPIKAAVNLMAGIPSVVYGFFGLVVLVPFVRNSFGGRGPSVLTACVLLGLMILPTIVSVSETSIRAVPQSYYEGALALGASHERSVFFAVLPAAKSGIFAGVVLGIGRAVGETMAVKMVAGNQPAIPGSILEGARTLTTNIVMEMGYATDLHREALIGTAVVLFVLILLINISLSLIKRRGSLHG